ncbi:hypothetical protein NZK32_02430 [Cyanobium sp. FGCU-52]|nr:hypothetical protein [Cyanobium sp. FGCU52]
MEPLQGWHLPLLDDPELVPVQPLAQRALLLALPDRLMGALSPRRPRAPQVLLALGRDPEGRSHVLGLIGSRRLNRSGSCWQVEQLLLSGEAGEARLSPGRRPVTIGLLQEAIQRARGAASWIATVNAADTALLAALREQGFQPLRTDCLWRWQPPHDPGDRDDQAANGPAAELQLRALNRRTAALLWHLEQAACPAQLRQLLDRRVEDLLDQSHGWGWMLVDPSRNQAVAGVRRLEEHPAGGHLVEFSLHPGWSHLLGPATERLLRRIAAPAHEAIWLQAEVGDEARRAWLDGLGAEPRGEQVLMARSVWRRQEGQPARGAARRIEAVLEQLQPRRRPLPTPVVPR